MKKKLNFKRSDVKLIYKNFFKNGDLSKYIKSLLDQNQKLTDTEEGKQRLYSWIYKLFNGLRFIHSQSITHRDIKPR